MANAFATVGTQDVNVLISQINQRLNTEMPKMGSVYKEIALTDSTSSSKYQHYPIHITSFNFNQVLAFENAEYAKPTVIDIVVPGVDFKTPLEMQSLGAFDDPYSIIKRQAPDFIRVLSRVFDRELAKLINSNGLAYDGQPFFGVHSSNPSKIAAPNNNNILTGAGPDKNGVIQALLQLQSMIGYDGNLLLPDLNYSDVTFVVPSIKQKIGISEVINAGLTAEAVGATSGGSTETRLAGYGNIVVMPELIDTRVAGSDRRWYAIASGMRNSLPALIVRDYMMPQLRVIGSNEWLDHQRLAQAFYGQAAGGAGFGLPSTIVRCDY